jgi:hypothetical protein
LTTSTGLLGRGSISWLQLYLIRGPECEHGLNLV